MGKGSNYGLSEIQQHAGLRGHIDNSVTVNSKCVPAVCATQLTCSADCVCGFHVTWTGV